MTSHSTQRRLREQGHYSKDSLGPGHIKNVKSRQEAGTRAFQEFRTRKTAQVTLDQERLLLIENAGLLLRPKTQQRKNELGVEISGEGSTLQTVKNSSSQKILNEPEEYFDVTTISLN